MIDYSEEVEGKDYQNIMRKAQIWWASKPRNKDWNDMNINERQKVIRAFYMVQLEPTRESFKKSTEKHSSCRDCGKAINGDFEYCSLHCPEHGFYDGICYKCGKKESVEGFLLDAVCNECGTKYSRDNVMCPNCNSVSRRILKRPIESDDPYITTQSANLMYGTPFADENYLQFEDKVNFEKINGSESLLYDIYNIASMNEKQVANLLANEGGNGSGKSGHAKWMNQFEIGGDNKKCSRCGMITIHINDKCDVCSNFVSSSVESFSADISKYDPNDPDYQYLKDYPNDGARWDESADQGVSKEMVNEVIQTSNVSRTCLNCGSYFDEPEELQRHTC